MATRIIIEVESGEVRPIAVRHVEMFVPEPVPATASSELYAEVRDESELPLLTVSVSGHLRPTEVFSPDGSIGVVDSPRQRQTVMLLLPEVEGGRFVVFMRRSSRDRGDRPRKTPQSDGAEAQELARVSLETGGQP